MGQPLFDEAIAVFEGGGVRGLAYLGAYARACDLGLRFYGAAGTSVGSLAAALVAAGFNGEELYEVAQTLEPRTFLAPPDRPRSKGRRLVNYLVGAPAMSLRAPFANTLRLWTHLGRYSTAGIGKWLDDVLAEKIRQSTGREIQGPVTFSDLPKPLAIFATDLSNGKPKVWDSETSKDVSVAFAVQCSCAIPFFFQPVWADAGNGNEQAYVDGGVLANLPLHLVQFFKDSEHLPIIAFRLEGDDLPTLSRRSMTMVDLGMRTANAVVGGNTHLQLLQNPRVAELKITTGNVATTDFGIPKEQQSQLYKDGAEAVSAFLESPERLLELPVFSESLMKTVRSAILDRFVHDIRTANSKVCGFIHDLRLLVDLIPVLLRRMKEPLAPTVELVYHPKGTESADEMALASRLGCSLRATRTPVLLRGILKDPHTPAAAMTLIEKAIGDDRSVRVLEAQAGHADLVNLYAQYFRDLWTSGTPVGEARSTPALYGINEDIVIRQLRHVAQYANDNVEMCSTEIDPNETTSLHLFLESWRVRRVSQIVKVCELYGVKFCGCAHLEGTSRISIPPVIEQSGNKLVVIRGHHRVFYARRAKIKRLPAILVSGVMTPLPASAVKWDVVRDLPTPVDDQKRHRNFRPDFRRSIGIQLAALGNMYRTSVNGQQLAMNQAVLIETIRQHDDKVMPIAQ